MLKIAVLASGRGSNLHALLAAIAAGRLHARVAGVFSDKPDAPALQLARDAGIHAEALRARGFATRADYDEQMFSRVDSVHPDLIVCAGYMRLVSETAVHQRLGRMINIHPSLLPAFKGLHTHRQALEAGVVEHGASVHFVSAELDGGPVVAQARVPVLAGDDERTLAQRVLTREHPLLVAVLQGFAAGRLSWRDGRACCDGEPLPAPLQLADDNLHLHPGATSQTARNPHDPPLDPA